MKQGRSPRSRSARRGSAGTAGSEGFPELPWGPYRATTPCAGKSVHGSLGRGVDGDRTRSEVLSQEGVDKSEREDIEVAPGRQSATSEVEIPPVQRGPETPPDPAPDQSGIRYERMPPRFIRPNSAGVGSPAVGADPEEAGRELWLLLLVLVLLVLVMVPAGVTLRGDRCSRDADREQAEDDGQPQRPAKPLRGGRADARFPACRKHSARSYPGIRETNLEPGGAASAARWRPRFMLPGHGYPLRTDQSNRSSRKSVAAHRSVG